MDRRRDTGTPRELARFTQVTILVNGDEAYRATPERNLRSLVESVLDSGDWTRIYPFRIRVEVPPPRSGPDGRSRETE